MVGVPAHAVESKTAPIVPHFDPYATQDEEDPLLKTVETLTKQLETLQKRIDSLEQDSLQTAGRWEGKK
jgi:hypothetical protein